MTIFSNRWTGHGQCWCEHCRTNFRAATGRGVLCNAPANGVEAIEGWGEEHLATGDLIVYMSVDSVLQIAAHVDVVPVGELYDACAAVREVMSGPDAVGRVIARPFEGAAGAFSPSLLTAR